MTEWISVEDRLPIERRQVITYAPNVYQPFKIDYLISYDEEYIWACRNLQDAERYKVTHWMELSKPQKADKSSDLCASCQNWKYTSIPKYTDIPRKNDKSFDASTTGCGNDENFKNEESAPRYNLGPNGNLISDT